MNAFLLLGFTLRDFLWVAFYYTQENSKGYKTIQNKVKKIAKHFCLAI